MVWYAAYGSNLLRERFELYLSGGSLSGVATRAVHQGARDSSPPAGARIARIDHQLRFAGQSPRWGGAPAFLDPTPGSGSALVRQWLVTAEQFEDVAAQENAMPAGSLSIDVDDLVARGSLDITERWYGRAVCIGHVDGRPVVTFTCRDLSLDVAAPSASYLGTIVSGLVQSGVADDEIAATLLEADGVVPAWSRSDVEQMILAAGLDH